jgi:RES domain-containing protein
VKLWRIAAETRQFKADDLSGRGAAANPGRWNDEGEPVVYCAPTIAMAVLETASHIDDAGLPMNRYLIEIDVPDTLWEQREEKAASQLPVTWDAVPAGQASVKVGSGWINSRRTAVLVVPSVIVPDEFICLINPGHKSASRIRTRVVRLFEYHRLFRGG